MMIRIKNIVFNTNHIKSARYEVIDDITKLYVWVDEGPPYTVTCDDEEEAENFLGRLLYERH